jgi:hypothetical protein
LILEATQKLDTVAAQTLETRLPAMPEAHENSETRTTTLKTLWGEIKPQPMPLPVRVPRVSGSHHAPKM